MIGNCLVLLCVAFGIAAGSCLQVPRVQYELRQSSPVVSSQLVSAPVVSSQFVSAPVVSSQVVSSPVVSSQVVSSPVVSSQYVSSPVQVVQISGNNQFKSGYTVGNVVSSGIIASEGPETAPLPVVRAPDVTLPAVESPIVALPSQPIPAPRVISQRCVCTKTIVKPQVIQRQVTIPKVQRYLKRTVTPIVENLTYKTRPVSSQRQSAVASAAPVVASNNCYSRIC